MEQSIESNFLKKFKAITSTVHTLSIFQIFLKKKIFFRKSSKPGHGKLVLIASTVQVELSKLNFNFDDVRTNFLKVLTYYGFSRLSCYDNARQNWNRTEQSSIVTIKIYNSSFM